MARARAACCCVDADGQRCSASQATLAEEVLDDAGVAAFRKRKAAALAEASAARGKGARRNAKAHKAARHAKRRGRV